MYILGLNRLVWFSGIGLLCSAGIALAQPPLVCQVQTASSYEFPGEGGVVQIDIPMISVYGGDCSTIPLVATIGIYDPVLGCKSVPTFFSTLSLTLDPTRPKGGSVLWHWLLQADANTTGSQRSGVACAAGNGGGGANGVIQGVPTCSFTVNPNPINFGSIGGGGALNVTATPDSKLGNPSSCIWTANSLSAWITGVSPTSGSGSGTVLFTVQSNSGATSRTGTIFVAGQSLSITQSALTVTLTLNNSQVAPSREQRCIAIYNFDGGPTSSPPCGAGLYLIPKQNNVVSASALVTDSLSTGPAPVAGQTVTFNSAVADVTAAGHNHGNAPSGAFEDILGNSTPATPTCQTGADGSCFLFFLAPTNSGRYTLSATAPNGASDQKALNVQVPNLEGLTIPTSNEYVLTGTTGTHLSNHYGTPVLTEAIQVVAAFYQRLTGDTLGINDMTLPWGGVFDFCVTGTENGCKGTASSWNPPHVLHRLGNSVDIDNHVLDLRTLTLFMNAVGLVRVVEGPIHFEVLRAQ